MAEIDKWRRRVRH